MTDVSRIRELFKDRKSRAFDISNYFAVLVPILEVNGEPHLVYQVRSTKLFRQPGEISFPGGKIEEDEVAVETALRETKEEMGIEAQCIEIIGELDYLLDSRNALIYPFLGILHGITLEKICYCKDEVSSIFSVPVSYFLENKPEVFPLSYKVNQDCGFPFHRIQNRAFYQNREMSFPMFFYEYQGYIIWGITAKITRNFIKELRKKILLHET